MHFQHPAILLLLWILPGVAALLVIAQKRRVAAARRFVEQPMIARLMPDLQGTRPWTKGILTLLGCSLLIVAAAQPQYGIYYEKVKQQHGVDCFALLDVSRSMLAEDVAPSRLDRAKSDIRDLLKKLGGDRVGLIVFAGKPVLKVPLTTDAGFFNMVLDDVDVHSAPRGGTLIGDAIRKALDALPPRGDHDQMLVLLSDGEDQESYPLDAAKLAAERGVKIFTVGLGDSNEGARIPVRDASGKLDYVKEEGKEHWSKTDQGVLQQIAQTTGGAHVSAGTRAYDLGQIYEDRIAELTRGEEQQDVNRRRYNDQYQIFLALGLLLLVIEHILPACTGLVRCRSGRTAATMLAACILGLATLGAAPADALAASAAGSVEKGITAFHAGDFKTAAEAFGEAAERLPNEPRIAFDRGCALAAQGEHDQAVEQYQLAAAAQNRDLAAAAYYNLGCLALAKAKTGLGEKPEEAKPDARQPALDALAQAAGHLTDCLTVDPEHADARYNLEAIRLWTKHIQEVWRQRDRQERRQKMDLMQFLQWLEKEQRDLLAKDRPLEMERLSPRRREAIRAAEYAQRDLTDEIDPLKEKLHAALTTPPTQNGPANAPASPQAAAGSQPADPEAQRALALLDNLADDARQAMNGAADALAAQKMSDAAKPQAEAIEKIDSIFMVVSPFVELVKKGIANEEGLIAQSKGAAPEAKQESGEENKDEPKAENGKKDAAGQPAETDWAESAWNQRFVSNYGRILAAKAKRELEQLAKTPDAPPDAKDSAGPPSAETPVAPAPDAAADPKAKAQKQKEEMKRALQAGIDLAPKVVEQSDEAAKYLEASQPAAALPPQEETLKLLKEMLPKDDQKNNDQDKKDQDKKDQDKKDQDKKKQDKKNQDKQDQDKKNQDKKEQDKKDQDKGSPKPKDQQPKPDKQEKNQDKDKQQVKQDPSKQQAEAAMRAVRQRQQERREKERVLLEKLYRPDRVDKDW